MLRNKAMLPAITGVMHNKRKVGSDMKKIMNDDMLEGVNGGAQITANTGHETGKCSSCKETFRKSDLVLYNGRWYCHKCYNEVRNAPDSRIGKP